MAQLQQKISYPFVTIVIFTLAFLNTFTPTNSYCWQVGWNPSFSGRPAVTQLSMTSVKVSWGNVVKTRECADQFLVKYWKAGSPNDYVMSKQLATDINSVILKNIVPKIEYQYQVIAREEKPTGVDYNRAEAVTFRTSRKRRPPPKKSKNNNIAANSIGDDGGRAKPDPEASEVITNPADNSDTEDQGDDNTIILLILVIIGALVSVLIVVGIIYNCIKRRKQGRNILSGKGSTSLKDDVESSGGGNESDDENMPLKEVETENVDKEAEDVEATVSEKGENDANSPSMNGSSNSVKPHSDHSTSTNEADNAMKDKEVELKVSKTGDNDGDDACVQISVPGKQDANEDSTSTNVFPKSMRSLSKNKASGHSANSNKNAKKKDHKKNTQNNKKAKIKV